MLNVFDLHFATPEEKAVSRICASKTRTKIANVLLAGASRFKEKCLRKAQRYQSSLNEEKSLCKLNSLTFAAKKPQPL
jgi:hypothetical protein